VDVTSDYQKIIVGSLDGSIKIYNYKNKALIKSVVGHTKLVFIINKLGRNNSSISK